MKMRTGSKFSVDELLNSVYTKFCFAVGGEGMPAGGGGGTPEGGGDAGGSGGGVGGATGTPADAGAGAFDITKSDIWNPTPTPASDVTPATPAATPTGGTAQPTAMETFDKRVADLPVPTLAMTEEEAEAFFTNRDLAGLNAHIGKSLRDVYKTTIMDTMKMISQVRGQMMDEIKTESRAVHTAGQNTAALRSALPFTGNPNVSPIADAVLSAAMTAGKSADDAINMVRQFFQQTTKLGAKDLGISLPPSNAPGSGRFGANAEDETGGVDWVALLSHGNAPAEGG